MRTPSTLHTARIVSTGDELLRGTVADTNATFLAARLREHGLSLQRVTVVGDSLVDISAALREAATEADLVLVGGGLGPTTDDLTAQAASLAFGAPLVRFPEAESMVRRVFARGNWPMAECNLKQADLPQSAEIVPNDRGTAPGFAVPTSRGLAVFFPGVPTELEAMWPTVARMYLPQRPPRPRITLSCAGMGESTIQEKLEALTRLHPDIVFSYRAAFPEIFVGFEGDDAALVRVVAEAAKRAIGPAVFDDEGRSVSEVLAQLLLSVGRSVATAESCTGGLIAADLTAMPGASAYYRGGVVAYDNEIKTALLAVPATDLERYGAVSEQVARAMAEGARRVLGADIALATTGIAGPSGGSPDKPVGLVHLAVATPQCTVHTAHVFQGYHRARVQRAAASAAMRLALDACREMP